MASNTKAAAKKPATKAASAKGGAVTTKSSKSTAVGAVIDYEKEMARFAERAGKQGDAVSGGQAVISFKGAKLSVGGVDLAKPEVEVILLDGAFENALYEGKYDPSNPQPPSCYAIGYDADELVPHEAVKDPQAKSCAECPNNEWDSGDNGRGKACKNVARLLVILPPDELTPENIADAEVHAVKVPVTSVKNWQAHLRKLRDVTGLPPMMSITTIHVAPDPKTQLKVTFEYSGVLDKKLFPALIAKAKDAEREIMRAYPEPQVIDTSALRRGAKKGAARGQASKPARKSKF